MIDENDFPGWMRLGKADCGWSNIAADETCPKYIRQDVVDATIDESLIPLEQTISELSERIAMLEAENNRLRRRTEFKW
jgi:hypothetical protein